MREEIWKDIEGYEGYYMVSNLGNVKSLNYKGTGKEGILKPKKDRYGYLQVGLSKDNEKKFYTVHRLVAQAFLDNSDNLPEVNHKDENKQNNHADNLEFCTSKYNANYGTRNEKLSKPIVGVDRVTGLIVEFMSAHEAERKLGINNGSIIKCCQGKSKSAGGFVWYYANVNDDDTE